MPAEPLDLNSNNSSEQFSLSYVRGVLNWLCKYLLCMYFFDLNLLLLMFILYFVLYCTCYTVK